VRYKFLYYYYYRRIFRLIWSTFFWARCPANSLVALKRTERTETEQESSFHSLANRHSCPTPARNEHVDVDSTGKIVGGMINQQTVFVYP